MKKILHIIMLLIWSAVLLCACGNKALDTDMTEQKSFESTIAFTVDTHYASQNLDVASLVVKQMKYNKEIVQSLLYSVQQSGTDTLLILGDITNSGTLQEHKEIIEILNDAQKNGLKIYVQAGNHDLGSISKQQFYDMYYQLGFNRALSQDKSSLSYSVQIDNKLLSMLDTNTPHGSDEGTVSPDTIAWLEKQLIYAEENQLKAVSASHNALINLVPKGSENPYIIENGDKLVDMLNKYSVGVHLSGHRHTRQINSFGTGLEIITEMPMAYPNSFGILGFGEGTVTYMPTKIDVEGYAKAMGITEKELLSFDEFSKNAVLEKAQEYAHSTADTVQLTTGECSEAENAFCDIYVSYLDGTLYSRAAEIKSDYGYNIWQTKLGDTRFGKWMELWVDSSKKEATGFTIPF